MIGLNEFAFECRDAALLCRQVAPEDLAGQAVYVLPLSVLPRQFDVASRGIISWYHPTNASLFRPTLEAAGIWDGEGFAISIRDDVASPCEVAPIALHELAHAVCPTDWSRRVYSRSTLREQWADHGADFIRMACHIFHRAGRTDYLSAAGMVFGGGAYGLRFDRDVYAAALGEEPATWEHRPLRSIARQPYPPGFWRLWQHDTTRAAS
jgi:hypothetical protein